MELALIWAAIIAFGITMYVLLDGFSLGIGILYWFNRDQRARDVMMGSVTPVWDGNQTWLVLGGALLFAGFPKAFNLLLSALYLPLSIMLIALVLRGAAFEFRFKSRHQLAWDATFIGGSTVAAFCQGIVLGTFVQGFELVSGHVQADWWTPFSVFTGFAVVVAYALLGSCWLVVKSVKGLQQWAQRIGQKLLVAALLCIAVVCIWTPFAQPAIAERWFSWPNALMLAPIPFWSAVMAGMLFWALRKKAEYLPFFFCVALFVLTLIGLSVSVWPYIVPRIYTIEEMAAPDDSLLFVLLGVTIIVPTILAYTAHAYYVFRHKVTPEDSYH